MDGLLASLKQLKASDLIRSNPARRDMVKQLLATAATARNSEEARVKEEAVKEIEDRSQQWAGAVPA